MGLTTQLRKTGWIPLLAVAALLMQQEAVAGRKWDSGGKPGKSFGGGKNKAPTISGTPATSADVGSYYSFAPRASDRNGDELNFLIKNLPEWASFDGSSGFLAGYPDANDAGTVTSNIVITVYDADRSTSLPAFSIRVGEADTNAPPEITGTPIDEVIASSTYDWKPGASDPDGDTLSFTVSNVPPWASFDNGSGRIHGLAQPADVGVYENIRVTVSDGQDTDTTSAFSISVVQTANGAATISWAAPDTNTDGSSLTDLSGFRVHYGTDTRNYDQVYLLSDPGTTTAVIENLSHGSWYFAVTALNSAGLESDYSDEVQQTVQ